jgi:hypothetical protein
MPTDWKSDLGARCNSAITDQSIRVNPDVPNWRQLMDWLNSLGSTPIRNVTINGHGGPDHVHPFTLDDLRNPNSQAYQFLLALGQKMSENGHITIKACNVARGPRGEEFISLMSQITGSMVTAYTDWYAVYPHGDELTADLWTMKELW